MASLNELAGRMSITVVVGDPPYPWEIYKALHTSGIAIVHRVDGIGTGKFRIRCSLVRGSEPKGRCAVQERRDGRWRTIEVRDTLKAAQRAYIRAYVISLADPI